MLQLAFWTAHNQLLQLIFFINAISMPENPRILASQVARLLIREVGRELILRRCMRNIF